MIKSFRTSVPVTLVLLLTYDLIYPVVMTSMSQALFLSQANGSITYVDGQAVGARNVGQDSTDPCFIRCRLSTYRYLSFVYISEPTRLLK